MVNGSNDALALTTKKWE